MNNSASITPTRSSSNSSITICSFWSKKNINVKASNGITSISDSTYNPPSTSSRAVVQLIGILSLLDEEDASCLKPRTVTFTEKLNSLWGGESEIGHAQDHRGREKYTPSRFDQGFIVVHYAGDVEYRTDGWLEKNKDPLNDNLTRVLANSSDRFIASLFADFKDAPVQFPTKVAY